LQPISAVELMVRSCNVISREQSNADFYECGKQSRTSKADANFTRGKMFPRLFSDTPQCVTKENCISVGTVFMSTKIGSWNFR